MTHVRVVFAGQGPSGLPEDRVINVFHFAGLLGSEQDQADATLAVLDFYNGVNSTHSVGSWLSPWVQREATLTSYDMDAAKPRVPTVTPITLDTAASGSGLPEEVACCISIRGAVPPAVTARRRGRIYIGPLTHLTINNATANTPCTPNANFTADLRLAATRLLVHAEHPVVWQILSSVPQVNYVPVAGGWVDNALDTQRRRGPRPTARDLWPPAA